MMEEMKAWVVLADDPSDAFHETTVPLPKVGEGEVLVKSLATSLNPIDYKVRTDLKMLRPRSGILHCDIAGEIVEVGTGVSEFATGDRVMGICGGVSAYDGALSEYVCIDARMLVKIPEKMTVREAAAIPLVTITTYLSLFDKLNLDKRDSRPLLITGATGGVGHVAIQVAKAYGLTVHATVRTADKVQLAKSYGADESFVYDQADAQVKARAPEGYHHIFDTVGGNTLAKTLGLMALGGQTCTINTRQKIDLTNLHGKGGTLHVTFMLLPLISGKNRERYSQILEDTCKLFEADKLSVKIDSSQFTYEQALSAHEHYENKKYLGKIVLTKTQLD